MAESHEPEEPAVEEHDAGHAVEHDAGHAVEQESTEIAGSPNGAPLEKTSTSGSKRKPLEERSKGKIAIIMGALGMAVFLAALDAVRLLEPIVLWEG
jgi:hypothetical protein